MINRYHLARRALALQPNRERVILRPRSTGDTFPADDRVIYYGWTDHVSKAGRLHATRTTIKIARTHQTVEPRKDDRVALDDGTWWAVQEVDVDRLSAVYALSLVKLHIPPGS